MSAPLQESRNEEEDGQYYYDDGDSIDSNDKESSAADDVAEFVYHGGVIEDNESEEIQDLLRDGERSGGRLFRVIIGVDISVIDKYAFLGCYNMIDVVFHNNVTRIEERAFLECARKLQNIKLPEGLIHIGKEAFMDCHYLEGEIVIPRSVQYIGDKAFMTCSSIESVVFHPDANVELGFGVFERCFKLRSVALPNNLECIPAWTFDDCESLEDIRIPDPVTEIKECTFLSCKKLRSIDFSENIVQIKDGALTGCTSLECVTVRNSSSSFRIESKDTFDACYSLKTIKIYPWLWPKIFESVMDDLDTEDFIYRFLKKYQNQIIDFVSLIRQQRNGNDEGVRCKQEVRLDRQQREEEYKLRILELEQENQELRQKVEELQRDNEQEIWVRQQQQEEYERRIREEYYARKEREDEQNRKRNEEHKRQMDAYAKRAEERERQMDELIWQLTCSKMGNNGNPTNNTVTPTIIPAGSKTNNSPADIFTATNSTPSRQTSTNAAAEGIGIDNKNITATTGNDTTDKNNTTNENNTKIVPSEHPTNTITGNTTDTNIMNFLFLPKSK